ncbi:MAG: hypothetical protein AAGJ35_04780, partial [Myxococcota bacterium]
KKKKKTAQTTPTQQTHQHLKFPSPLLLVVPEQATPPPQIATPTQIIPCPPHQEHNNALQSHAA